MKTSRSNNSNQTATNASWLWNYGKQALKGISVMGIGVLGYMGLRGYWRSDNTTSQTKSTDLVSAADESTTFIKKDLTNTPVSTPANLWNSVGQSLQYRRKRGVVNPIGIEFQVNNFTLFNQIDSAIAALNNGNFVIVWDSEGQDGYREGIFAQIFASDGSRLGYEFQVNTYVPEAQIRPDVATLANNNFVVVWQSYNQDFSYYGVYGQIFNSTGGKVGNEFQVNTFYVLEQEVPAVAAIPNGNFMVVWSSLGQAIPNSPDIFGQVFNISGGRIGSELKINNDSNGNWPSITGLKDNSFVVAWHTATPSIDPSGFGCAGQRLNAIGNKLAGEFLINSYTLSDQVWPRLAALPNGGFVATWISGREPSWSIHAQQFNSMGYKVNNEFQANTYIGKQLLPAVIAFADSSFLITWHSDLQDGSGYGVYAQWFGSNSNKLGREFQVNAYILDSQMFPRITRLTNGNAVITWQSWGQDGSNEGIFARILTPSLLPFVYNLDIPKSYTESTPYPFSDVVVNPMVNAGLLNLTLTLSNPTLGTLNQPNAGNVTAVYNNTTGRWFASGTVVEINKLLSQLILTPTLYYHGNIDIGVFLSDGVHPNFNGTLSMQGIPVDNPPVLSVQSFVVDQGTLLTITANMFNASNPDPTVNNTIHYQTDRVLQARVANTVLGQDVFSFTEAEMAAESIKLMPDESGIAPSFDITAIDDVTGLRSNTTAAVIFYNQRPKINSNQVTITYNQTVTVGSNEFVLNVTDDHTSFDNLRVYAKVTDGGFIKGTAAVSSFTVAEFLAGQINFATSGTNVHPVIKLLANDGRINSIESLTTVSFTFSSPAANVVDNSPTIAGAVGGTGAALLLAGAGIFGAYRYRRSKQLEEQRANYPLANALYHELKIPDTEDFQSEKGIAFTNAVDSLNNELIRSNIDIKQMVAEEIAELAHKLANATKAQLGKKINLLDIQDYAQSIVATAMTLTGKNKTADADVELSAISNTLVEPLLNADKRAQLIV